MNKALFILIAIIVFCSVAQCIDQKRNLKQMNLKAYSSKTETQKPLKYVSAMLIQTEPEVLHFHNFLTTKVQMTTKGDDCSAYQQQSCEKQERCHWHKQGHVCLSKNKY